MKMEFKDINTFLHNHVGENWFDLDLQLFKKVFPTSKLIPELEKAQKYNKAHLDERMCNELMTNAVCDCTIWENRGYTKDKDGFIVPMKSDEAIDFEGQLQAMNLDEKQKYNDLKALVIGLGIPTKDQTAATYLAALKEQKLNLSNGGSGEATLTTTEALDGNTSETTDAPKAFVKATKAKAPKAEPKKKQAPGKNTRK
jgi:hypothetical protein